MVHGSQRWVVISARMTQIKAPSTAMVIYSWRSSTGAPPRHVPPPPPRKKDLIFGLIIEWRETKGQISPDQKALWLEGVGWLAMNIFFVYLGSGAGIQDSTGKWQLKPRIDWSNTSFISSCDGFDYPKTPISPSKMVSFSGLCQTFLD